MFVLMEVDGDPLPTVSSAFMEVGLTFNEGGRQYLVEYKTKKPEWGLWSRSFSFWLCCSLSFCGMNTWPGESLDGNRVPSSSVTTTQIYLVSPSEALLNHQRAPLWVGLKLSVLGDDCVVVAGCPIETDFVKTISVIGNSGHMSHIQAGNVWGGFQWKSLHNHADGRVEVKVAVDAHLCRVRRWT